MRAIFAFQNAEKEVSGRYEVAFSLGIAWSMCGKIDTALEYFVKALEPQLTDHAYYPLKLDEALIFDYIGAGLHTQGKLNEAKIAWRRSLDLELAKPEQGQNKNRIEIQKRMLA